jgi:hypothetical protein
VAAALVTAHVLLGKKEIKYVGVEPCIVLAKNLRKAWSEILHLPEPDFLKSRWLIAGGIATLPSKKQTAIETAKNCTVTDQ